MKLNQLLAWFCLISLPAGALAQAELSTHKQKLSYAIGVNIANQIQQLKNQNLDIEADIVIEAIQEALRGEQRMSQEEIAAVYQEQQAKMEMAKREEAMGNKTKGEEFLTANLNEEGVTATASGLQYKVIEAGTGEKPGPADTVVVHYRGTLVDGEVFDSSYDRNTPATFQVNGVIKGWQEGLQLMSEGAKWMFYIPSELAYGEKGAGRIPPSSVLVFEVELLEVK